MKKEVAKAGPRGLGPSGTGGYRLQQRPAQENHRNHGTGGKFQTRLEAEQIEALKKGPGAFHGILTRASCVPGAARVNTEPAYSTSVSS